MSLCQSGCKFNSYNKTTKTTQCDCNVQSVSVESSSGSHEKEDFKESFVDTLLNSNFIILKCLKLVFSSGNIFSNKGRVITSVVGVFFIITIIIFLAVDRKNINKYFGAILTDKMNGNSIIKSNNMGEEISIYKGKNIMMNKDKFKNINNSAKNYNFKNKDKVISKQNKKDLNKKKDKDLKKKNEKNNNFKQKENKMNLGSNNKDNKNNKNVINNKIIIIGNKHKNKKKNRHKHTPPKKNNNSIKK